EGDDEIAEDPDDGGPLAAVEHARRAVEDEIEGRRVDGEGLVGAGADAAVGAEVARLHRGGRRREGVVPAPVGRGGPVREEGGPVGGAAPGGGRDRGDGPDEDPASEGRRGRGRRHGRRSIVAGGTRYARSR